jgi:hypothetical protein
MGSISGHISSDTFKFRKTSNEEIKDIKFLLVSDQEGANMSKLKSDGMIGLGLEHIDNKNLESSNDKNEYSNFIYQLYLKGLIRQPKFSIFISPGGQMDSKLFIGDFSKGTTIAPVYKQMNYCDVDKGMKQWGCEIGSVELKGNKLPVNSKVIIDSGVSFFIIPIMGFNLIKKHLLDNNEWKISSENGQLLSKCDGPETFPPQLKLLINGNPFIINIKDIVQYFPTLTYQCRFDLAVDMDSYNTWVLGTSVMKNSLFSFDMISRKLGFVQNPKDMIVYMNTNIVIPETEESGGSKIGYIFVLVFIGVLMFGIYKFANNDQFINSRRSDSFSYENINDRQKMEMIQNKFNENEYDYDELKGGQTPHYNVNKSDKKVIMMQEMDDLRNNPSKNKI